MRLLLYAALLTALGMTGCMQVTCSNKRFNDQPTCMGWFRDCTNVIRACKQTNTEF